MVSADGKFFISHCGTYHDFVSEQSAQTQHIENLIPFSLNPLCITFFNIIGSIDSVYFLQFGQYNILEYLIMKLFLMLHFTKH
jgi:hypothetical protein